MNKVTMQPISHGSRPQVAQVIVKHRAIRGVELICRLQETPAGVRYSIRSEDPAFPAIQIARRLGGGGHTMAAGALLEGGALEEAEALLLKYAGEMLNGG